jgi:hypothetical protein
MTPRQFAALAAAAALSLAAAVAVYVAHVPWTVAGGESAPLFSGFGDVAPKVARVDITQGGKTLTIDKAGDAWQIASQGGYPASAEKIRALLVALADARLVEPKTRNPDRLGLLEVDDPATKNSNTRLIKLEDAGGAVLAEVLAGKSRPGQVGAAPGASTAGTYVRKPGDPQSWLASTSIAGGASLRDWVEPRVFETQTEKVSSLEVEVQGEPAYAVKKEADGTHTLADIPAGKKIKYVNVVENMVEAASFLEFESVRKATGAQGGEAGTVTLVTDNGLKIVMKIRRENGKTWATVAATGDGPAKDTAAAIAKRADGWEFEITPNKVDTMLKKKDDMIENAAS